jgi:hypothetical protein
MGFACMLQLLSGAWTLPWNVTSWPEIICDPFIGQSATAPLSLRQSTSDLASPLKSPTSAMYQDASACCTLPWKETSWFEPIFGDELRRDGDVVPEHEPTFAREAEADAARPR